MGERVKKSKKHLSRAFPSHNLDDRVGWHSIGFLLLKFSIFLVIFFIFHQFCIVSIAFHSQQKSEFYTAAFDTHQQVEKFMPEPKNSLTVPSKQIHQRSLFYSRFQAPYTYNITIVPENSNFSEKYIGFCVSFKAEADRNNFLNQVHYIQQASRPAHLVHI